MIRLLRSALLAVIVMTIPAASFAQFSIGISINIAPPILPVYVQPPCPQPNYIWTPGYWAWDSNFGDYFWVPGTWVVAPQPGLLWTPGYWGWGDGGVYLFHAGYWGPHVGFYGGVNYGFGYGGNGFGGGEWRGGVFAYNTAVVNVNTTIIHNTYINRTVINNTTVVHNHTSFNGGPNGIAARPTAQEQSYASERHIQPTSNQLQQEKVASQDRSNFASVNHGVPAHAATPRPATSVAELQHAAVPGRVVPGAKPYVAKPAPKAAAAQHPAAKPQMENHAAGAKPAKHPQPVAKHEPEGRPEARPAPAARTAAKPAGHTAARPAPAAARPAARPAEHSAAKPAPKPKEQKPEEHRPN